MTGNGIARDPAGPPAVRIEDLEPGHRRAVVALLSTVDLFTPAEREVAREVLDAYLARPGQDYHAVGAFSHQGLLLGYACWGPTPCTEGTWDLYWIAVAGSARGRGIGSLLMEEMDRKLAERDARLVLIETSSREDYAPTRAFYERRGYHLAATVPDFYAPGDDRVIFARHLQTP